MEYIKHIIGKWRLVVRGNSGLGHTGGKNVDVKPRGMLMCICDQDSGDGDVMMGGTDRLTGICYIRFM